MFYIECCNFNQGIVKYIFMKRGLKKFYISFHTEKVIIEPQGCFSVCDMRKHL